MKIFKQLKLGEFFQVTNARGVIEAYTKCGVHSAKSETENGTIYGTWEKDELVCAEGM